MGCNCKITELIIAAVIIVFALYEVVWSKWIIIIAAILLGIHALMCKNCNACAPDMKASKGKKK